GSKSIAREWVGWVKGNISFGGAFCFAKYEIRKRKRKGSKTRSHSSPDPSCGREESRGGAIPFPQKNSLPSRVQISFRDFRQKMFELRSKNTANFQN
ncbi:hypothetical protein KKG80_00145, partial [Patescibacteria group bacterium]|nr:hypothetical protein [Patescibacteria group bacterium]